MWKGCEHEFSCQNAKSFKMADPQVGGESQFIRDIEKSAIDAFNEEHPYEQSFYNDVAGFVAAVNWEADGHWLTAFAAVHAVFFILIVFCRRVEIVQLATFVSICGLVLASEVVNAFLHEHWRDFATQDYFDEHGVFFSCLFSGPLLILGFLQVRFWFFISFLHLLKRVLLDSASLLRTDGCSVWHSTMLFFPSLF